MNYQEKRKLENSLKNSFFPTYPKGCIKITSGSSVEHEFVKCQVCYWLLKNGYDFWTEAKLGTSRPDIIAIKGHIGYILEIMHSESDEKMLNKLGKEYGDFLVIPIKTGNFDYNSFKL
jgi:hypothetical protein